LAREIPILCLHNSKAPSSGNFETWQLGTLRKSIDRLLGDAQKQGHIVNRKSLRTLVGHWDPTRFRLEYMGKLGQTSLIAERRVLS